ncbi:class I SAM-dependent methyltransferase [Acaryochloris marina]|nr:class I SAM-dependent methyltransferase [Acaryochloris marina]
MYNRLLAWGMARANTVPEENIKLNECQQFATMAQLKHWLFADLHGTVLELGPGAGINLSYYPPDINWIGIELNPFLHPYIRQEADRQGLSSINVFKGTAEQLPVADNSIDTVVSTYVLCSVTQLEECLSEIQRVLKPGGLFVFLEHVAAKPMTLERRIQEAVKPLWKTLLHNCHPNRETWKTLEKAGFEWVHYQHFRLSLPVVSPQIVGKARKSLETTLPKALALTSGN